MDEEILENFGFPLDVKSIITPQSILFFDMDGTLIETSALNNYSYTTAFKTVMNYEMPKINAVRITRKILLQNVSISTEDYNKIVAEKERQYLENLSLAVPKTCTVDLLKEYSEKNNAYLITRCQKHRAVATVSHFGLLDRFVEIFSCCSENKYSEVVNYLGVNPANIIAFEDEEKEIEACLKAGILNHHIIKITENE